METVNNSQLETSDSSMSLANNSTNSLSSLSLASPSADKNGLTSRNVFGAFQTVALNNYGSTNSLASFDGSSPEESPFRVPFVIQKMMFIFDEFMHNHSYVEDNVSKKEGMGSPREHVAEFPKFC